MGSQYYYYYISYPEAQKIKEVIEMVLQGESTKEAREAARRIRKELENVRSDVKYKFGGYQATILKRDSKIFEEILELAQIAIQRVERGD